MSTLDISRDAAVHAVEVAAIILTVFNAVAAAIVLLLVCIDNYRQQKSWWRLSWERRTPFYLAISILSSHAVFVIREILEMTPIVSNDVGDGVPQMCIAANESSWWAIWFPILALAMRACLMAGAIILGYNPFSKTSESMYVFVVTTVSILLWLPSRILVPTSCSTFVMVFSGESGSSFGLVGTIILCSLLLFLCISQIVIAWDTCRPAPPNRRSLYLEFNPVKQEDRDSSLSSQMSAKKTLIYYGLGMFCLYACLLPNFALESLSRTSQPAVYVASIAIHASGIILLYQYLFMRNTCSKCNGDSFENTRETYLAHSQLRHDQLRRSLSDYSTMSEEYTRKRRRPHTTYGGGGDYLRRESLNASWESFQPATVDRTASGRRIPPRSPKFDSRPRTAESKSANPINGYELKRSKSYSGRENSSAMRQEPLTSISAVKLDEVGEKVPDLLRQGSGRKLRRRVDQIQPSGEIHVMPAPEETNTPQTKISEPPATTGDVQQPALRPILLPPLPRSGLRKEASPRPLSGKFASGNADPLPSITRPLSFPSSIPLRPAEEPIASTSQATSPTSSDFVFPFRPTSDETVNAMEYKEDISSWRPRNDGPVGNSTDVDVDQVHYWPLQLEDLLDPDPPFASENRHYICLTPSESRPSESRLSTITEEGTVRESVATPPNIIVTDASIANTAKEGSHFHGRTPTPLTPTMASWFTQGGPQYDVDGAMNRLCRSPSPRSATSSNTVHGA